MLRVDKIETDFTVVRNSVHGTVNMINVHFVEYGRDGVNAELALSSNTLSRILGVETGLPTQRTHSQLMTPESANILNEGQDIDGAFINRIMHSTPQMEQQINTKPRMVDNKPTWFTTVIAPVAKQDEDRRIDNDKLRLIHPEYFEDALVNGTATVKRINTYNIPGTSQSTQDRLARGPEDAANTPENKGNENLETAGLNQKTG